jgi:hypothetical protein
MGGKVRHRFAAFTTVMNGNDLTYTFTPASIALREAAVTGRTNDGSGGYDQLTFGVTGISNKTFSIEVDLVGEGNWVLLEASVGSNCLFAFGPSGGVHDTSNQTHEHEPWPPMLPHSVGLTFSAADANVRISVHAWG